MCTAAAVSLTVNQGALPESSNSVHTCVEKKQFVGLMAILLPHLHKALQQHSSHAHACISKQPAAHLSPLVLTIKEEATGNSHGCLA